MSNERNQEEELKFIKDSREFYYENKEEIFEKIEEAYKKSFLNGSFQGWTSNVYISPNSYVVSGAMMTGATTMDNYKGREIEIFKIPAHQDLYEITDESLDNIISVAEDIGIDLQSKVDKYKNEADEELDDYELEEYLKEELKRNDTAEYEKVINENFANAVDLHWDEYRSYYEDEIEEAFRQLIEVTE
ncbi:MAG: hypothetical protein ACRCX8_19635 [Sarcina sp.]